MKGRNITEVLSMIQRIENHNNLVKMRDFSQSPIVISIEVEKPRSELLELLRHADVAFISKDFAISRGFKNMSESLENIKKDVKPK